MGQSIPKELYLNIKEKYIESISDLVQQLSQYSLNDSNGFNIAVDTAKRILYVKCLLDVIHQAEFNINEIGQINRIMSDERNYSIIIDDIIELGAKPETDSVLKYFKLVLRIADGYRHN